MLVAFVQGMGFSQLFPAPTSEHSPVHHNCTVLNKHLIQFKKKKKNNGVKYYKKKLFLNGDHFLSLNSWII